MREGGWMMGKSEEGTGRGMGGGREEASERGRDCARKGWSKGARKWNFKGGILSIQYIHTQSRNALLTLLHCYYK